MHHLAIGVDLPIDFDVASGFSGFGFHEGIVAVLQTTGIFDNGVLDLVFQVGVVLSPIFGGLLPCHEVILHFFEILNLKIEDSDN